MDPVSLIVAALAAGAIAGGKDAAADAVKEGYNLLKRLLVARFRTHSPATADKQEYVLAEHERDSENYAKPMEKVVRESGAEYDVQIVSAAQAILELADHDGRVRKQYNVDLRGAKGVQVGDHNKQKNRWS